MEDLVSIVIHNSISHSNLFFFRFSGVWGVAINIHTVVCISHFIFEERMCVLQGGFEPNF